MTKRQKRTAVLVALCVILLPVLLFVVNGLFLAAGETPVAGVTSHPPIALDGDSVEIKIMSYNIAKGFMFKGGMEIEDREIMVSRMQALADVINGEAPDLVFLSESVKECALCPVDQVEFLAEKTGMHSWVFGENYNIGLPFVRAVGGNAVLSRIPLTPLENPSLPGRKPFYVVRNNRRVLWCSLDIAGEKVLLASIHNDSFNVSNAVVQTRLILKTAGDRPAALAGDFNARHDQDPITLVRDSGRFSGEFNGPPTFPADEPVRTIDFVFAPKEWELIDHRVIDTAVSDHRPVVSTFRVSTGGDR